MSIHTSYMYAYLGMVEILTLWASSSSVPKTKLQESLL